MEFKNINRQTFNFCSIILLIILLFTIVIILWNEQKKEGMTAGTLTQLFSNDSQDVYLKSNVDKLATGNFDLYWNQPTKIANTFMNRGTPLPTIILPNTQLNPNAKTISSIPNNYTDYIQEKSKYTMNNSNSNLNSNSSESNFQLILPKKPNSNFNSNQQNQLEYKPEPRDYLFESTYNNLLFNKNCLKDPASCGGGSGGFRLGEDFNQSTKAREFVNLNGKLFYPDSYVGSYFIEPNFDIMKPYPFIPDSNLPPNPIKLG